MLSPDQPDDPGQGAFVGNFPDGDISFLLNIPPIGTKFRPAERTGPQGKLVMTYGRDDDPIELSFTFEF